MSAGFHFRLQQHSTPEIFLTPLHEIALSIKLLKLGTIREFLGKALEPPPLDAVIEAEVTLKGLSFFYDGYKYEMTFDECQNASCLLLTSIKK